MIIYRLTKDRYADNIDGYGAKLYGGRWNSKGFAALYTTEFISLAVLEMLIHIPLRQLPEKFSLMRIEVPEKLAITVIEVKNLKATWAEDVGYSRYIGDSFLKESKAVLLKVPSAVIPEENNFVLNTAHPDFGLVKINAADEFDFDERLFLRNE